MQFYALSALAHPHQFHISIDEIIELDLLRLNCKQAFASLLFLWYWNQQRAHATHTSSWKIFIRAFQQNFSGPRRRRRRRRSIDMQDFADIASRDDQVHTCRSSFTHGLSSTEAASRRKCRKRNETKRSGFSLLLTWLWCSQSWTDSVRIDDQTSLLHRSARASTFGFVNFDPILIFYRNLVPCSFRSTASTKNTQETGSRHRHGAAQ